MTDASFQWLPDRADHTASAPAPIQHGGDLHRAATQFDIPLDQWVDLSTGINPIGYPVPPIPASVWRRLPDDDDGLVQQAADYFGCAYALPVAGSQAAIRALPWLLPPGRVAIADLTYGEYAPAFSRAGHHVVRFAYPYRPAPSTTADRDGDAVRTSAADALAGSDALPMTLPPDIRYLVIVTPNNPTTMAIPVETLLHWRQTLAARDGALIVDEAFIDPTPEDSVAFACGATGAEAGLIVLRSIGKFFGLAGIRAGFVLGPRPLLDRLTQHLGAWTVSGPARHAMRHALADRAWQQATRARLHRDSVALQSMLAQHGLLARISPLFAWIVHPQAEAIQHALARHAIWTRRFAPTASAGGMPCLRIGLPANAEENRRLASALAALQIGSVTQR